MGFLHLGWESATVEEDAGGCTLAELSPLWAVVGSAVDLTRPGLPTVQRVLGWHPLHVAAMSGACPPTPAVAAARRPPGRRARAWMRPPLKRPPRSCHRLATHLLAWPLRSWALGPLLTSSRPSCLAPIRPFHNAGNIELIRRLVQQFDCDLRVKSMNSWTPLHYAAAYNQASL